MLKNSKDEKTLNNKRVNIRTKSDLNIKKTNTNKLIEVKNLFFKLFVIILLQSFF